MSGCPLPALHVLTLSQWGQCLAPTFPSNSTKEGWWPLQVASWGLLLQHCLSLTFCRMHVAAWRAKCEVPTLAGRRFLAWPSHSAFVGISMWQQQYFPAENLYRDIFYRSNWLGKITYPSKMNDFWKIAAPKEYHKSTGFQDQKNKKQQKKAFIDYVSNETRLCKGRWLTSGKWVRQDLGPKS